MFRTKVQEKEKKKKSDESSARLKTFPPSWQENQHQQHYVTPTHCGPQEPLLLKHHALHLRFSHHSLKSLPKTVTCKTSPRLSGPFTRASLSDLQSQFLQMSCISWPDYFLSHESCLLPSPGVSKAEQRLNSCSSEGSSSPHDWMVCTMGGLAHWHPSAQSTQASGALAAAQQDRQTCLTLNMRATPRNQSSDLAYSPTLMLNCTRADVTQLWLWI